MQGQMIGASTIAHNITERKRVEAQERFLNAIKYSPRAEKVIVRLFQDGDREQAIVSVQDFGIGIDKTHHEKIFERFYQVTDPEERTYPGLGIGLYISREIVARHQGERCLQHAPGDAPQNAMYMDHQLVLHETELVSDAAPHQPGAVVR